MSDITINVMPLVGGQELSAKLPIVQAPSSEKSPGEFQAQMKKAIEKNAVKRESKPKEPEALYGSTEAKPQSQVQDTKPSGEQGAAEQTGQIEQTQATDTSINSSTDTTNNVAQGIVGILEGFGLPHHTNELLAKDQQLDIAELPEQNIAQQTQLGEEDIAQLLLQQQEETTDIFHISARTYQSGQAQEMATITVPITKAQATNETGSVENTNNTDLTADQVFMQLRIQTQAEQNLDTQTDTASKQDTSAKDGIAFRAEQPNEQQKTSETETAEGIFSWRPGENMQVNEAQITAEVEQAPQAPQRMDMLENLSRIAEQVEQNAATGVQTFDMELKPEHLGKVNIKLVMDSEGIKAQIKASDFAAKELISRDLAQLQELFKARQINVTDIEVLYQSPSFDMDYRPSDNQWQQQDGNQNKQFTFGQVGPVDNSASYESFFREPDAKQVELATPDYSSREFTA
ncbi:flagellar hook-length control protein FliK [Eubacteriales bacterium OttesenSCG-928-N14]|nr:flagellar hook-length control protein FliK [Eubacteriales bacterium OttesenSCG-928-N14]